MKEKKDIFAEQKEGIVKKIYVFFKDVLLSLYPDSYASFSQRSYAKGLKYFFGVLLLSVVLMLALFLFNINDFSNALDREMTKFETLNITGDIELSEPVVLKDGRIIVANEQNYTGEDLLITQNTVTRKPVSCLVFRPLCWFSNRSISTDISDYSDITKYRDDLKGFLVLGTVLVMPGVLLLYLVYSAIKTLIVIFVLSLVGLVVSLVKSHRISYKQVFLIALYASTVMLLAEPFNLLLHSLYYIHIIVFILLYVIGIVLVGDSNKKKF